MAPFDCTECEILWALGVSTRKDAIAALEVGTYPDDPLMAETVENLLQKLNRMSNREFALTAKLRPGWD